jgi:hypothetical protein
MTDSNRERKEILFDGFSDDEILGQPAEQIEALAGCGKSLSASQMAPIDPRKSLILGSAKRDLCCFLHRSGLFPQPASAQR